MPTHKLWPFNFIYVYIIIYCCSKVLNIPYSIFSLCKIWQIGQVILIIGIGISNIHLPSFPLQKTHNSLVYRLL